MIILALLMVLGAIIIGSLVIYYIGLWKVFQKAGKNGWAFNLGLIGLNCYKAMMGDAEYETIDNPHYPKESYEAFIARMIEKKKLKIEKVLDLK